MKRGTSRFPPNQFRIKSEDVIRESDTQMVKAEIIDSAFALMEDYHENVQIRNQMYQESKNFEKTEDDEEEDEYDTANPYSSTNGDPTTRGVSFTDTIAFSIKLSIH
jgi:hypothetical protein